MAVAWETPDFQNWNDSGDDSWNGEPGPVFTQVNFGKPSSFDAIEFGDVTFYNVALSVADLQTLDAHTQYVPQCAP